MKWRYPFDALKLGQSEFQFLEVNSRMSSSVGSSYAYLKFAQSFVPVFQIFRKKIVYVSESCRIIAKRWGNVLVMTKKTKRTKLGENEHWLRLPQIFGNFMVHLFHTNRSNCIRPLDNHIYRCTQVTHCFHNKTHLDHKMENRQWIKLKY